MKKHSALQVAEWFLAYNRIMEAEYGAEMISNIKLQKLLYYAQGSFLALTGGVIFDDDIKAWKQGPVVEDIFNKYREYNSAGIPFEDDFDSSLFDKDENDILKCVYEEFGQFSAWKLKNMVTEEEPWRNTKQNHIIPISAIQEYFRREYLAE